MRCVDKNLKSSARLNERFQEQNAAMMQKPIVDDYFLFWHAFDELGDWRGGSIDPVVSGPTMALHGGLER